MLVKIQRNSIFQINICLHKNLYVNVLSNFICNSKNWDQMKCEWLTKPSYIYTMEYYSAIKRDKLLIHSITEVDLRGIILHDKKKCAKDHMFDSVYITFSKCQNYRDEEKIHAP